MGEKNGNEMKAARYQRRGKGRRCQVQTPPPPGRYNIHIGMRLLTNVRARPGTRLHPGGTQVFRRARAQSTARWKYPNPASNPGMTKHACNRRTKNPIRVPVPPRPPPPRRTHHPPLRGRPGGETPPNTSLLPTTYPPSPTEETARGETPPNTSLLPTPCTRGLSQSLCHHHHAPTERAHSFTRGLSA